MTKTEAEKILAECPAWVNDERFSDNNRISLDGEFSADELQAILIVHFNREAA